MREHKVNLVLSSLSPLMLRVAISFHTNPTTLHKRALQFIRTVFLGEP